MTIFALLIGLLVTVRRQSKMEQELATLRREAGYLGPSPVDQIAAIRITSDKPLTYRLRIRVPDSPSYRIVYSSLLPRDAAHPEWFGAIQVPPGESVVTVRIAEDPRDERWKITTLVGAKVGTKRMATVLPDDHVRAFRGSHEVVSTGIRRETVVVDKSTPLRLLDERWLVGEGSLLLYGDRAPDRDQLGVYAELQLDEGTL